MAPAESDKNVDESTNVYNFRTIGCHRWLLLCLPFTYFLVFPLHISVVYPFCSHNLGSDNVAESSTTYTGFEMVNFRLTATEVNVTIAETGKSHPFYPISFREISR